MQDGHRWSASSPLSVAARRAAEVAAKAATVVGCVAGAAEEAATTIEAPIQRAHCQICGGSYHTLDHNTIMDAVPESIPFWVGHHLVLLH